MRAVHRAARFNSRNRGRSRCAVPSNGPPESEERDVSRSRFEAASDLPRRPLGRVARPARGRQPGRPDDARRLDLQRDRGAVRGGGRGRGRRVRGHARRCPPTSAAAILREISAGHQGAPRGARPAHRARGRQADPRRAGRGRPGDADLPARRRGGGADDRRARSRST